MATVEQELKTLREEHTEEEYVKGIRAVIVAMDEDRLIGHEFVVTDDGSLYDCFYGCFKNFDKDAAWDCAKRMRGELAEPVPGCLYVHEVTPIERIFRDNTSDSPEALELKATLLATIQ